jgi:S-DNA-T family DNA segregation ATPase FtsK/SpoIIIE
MRQSRLAPAHSYGAATDIRRMVFRNAVGAIGFCVLLAVAAITIALATWSVADPSFSHATSQPAHNRLGFLGAATADLLMQLIGLASAVALVAPLAVGWRMLMSGRHDITRWRLVWWAASTIGIATALAGFTVPLGWPLPVGLGGVIGDMLMRMPIALFNSQETGRVVGSLVFGAFGLFALLTAIRSTPAPVALDDELAADDRPRRRADALDDEDDDAGDHDGRLSLAAGILHHWLLVARANMLRLIGRDPDLGGSRRDRSRMDRQGSARGNRIAREIDDDLDFGTTARRVVVRGRQEPGFDQPRSRSLRVATAPSVADDHDAEMEDDIPSSYTSPRVAVPRPATRDRRVAPDIDPDYMPPSDYDEPVYGFDADPDYASPGPSRVDQRPAARSEPRVEPRPEPRAEPRSEGHDLVGGDQRRIAVGAAPKPIAQEKRPGGRMEAQGITPSGYQLPTLNFLAEPRRMGPSEDLSEEVLEGNAGILEGVLEDFGIKGEICHVRPGPVVTLYELEPAAGVKSSRVIGLADDIARSMSAVSARVAVVPGRNVIGIELPNQRRETVYLREMIASQEFGASKHKLAICLGKTIGGEPVIADLARMPHLLVAGTTGSGKSVAINTMILSLLYRLTPQQCKLIMIDPKMLELSVYDGIPHLLCPVVTDPKKAVVALKWSVREMEDRYKKMSKLGVRNIDGFNARVMEANERGETLTREIQTGFHRVTGEPIFEQEQLALEPLPYIVVVVDEMADLMMVAGKEIEGAIQRLAQMARAAGIHIVMATQRPSVDVITGTIKANFPTRISFQVTSKIDSRTILAEQGAEQLLGQGDMLYMAGGGRIQRVHGPFVSDDEVEKIVAHLKRQGAPQYLDAITAGDDEDTDGDGDAGGLDESTDLYDKAVAVVLRDKKPSTSYVQRRLQIGYNRAASLIERMEKEGVVSAPNAQGKREILVGGG